MGKPYVLGIDSGGTKYLVRAAYLNGTEAGSYRGPCASHYRYTREQAAEIIRENLERCLAAFDGRPEDCVRIVCGTTGYDSPEDGEEIQAIYDSLKYPCPISCMNDVELAHYTVTGGVGILALAGTGSIVFGRAEDGRECRVGGWPKTIMGDEGSGRYLDMMALRHYSRYLDGCRPDSPLIRTIARKVGESRKALSDYAMRMAAAPWPSPDLGKEIDRAAANGDPYAMEMLEEAAGCIFDLTREAILQLHMEKAHPLAVGMWGSVLLTPAMQKAFGEKIRREFPQAKLTEPRMDAAQGAVEIALRWQREGGTWQDIVRSRRQGIA